MFSKEVNGVGTGALPEDAAEADGFLFLAWRSWIDLRDEWNLDPLMGEDWSTTNLRFGGKAGRVENPIEAPGRVTVKYKENSTQKEHLKVLLGPVLNDIEY